MQTATKELINVLEGERIRRRLNHHGFSTLLGISDTYWHRIRHGERTLNLNMLTLFMQKLPEITPEVTIYIMRQGNDAGEGKDLEKMGGKKTPPYLGHGNPKTPPEKPSKNGTGG